MGRFQRTTKNLAQRIDLHYFQRSHPWRRQRFLLSVSIPALAVAWLGWQGLRQDRRTFLSPGPLSPAHAAFGQRCELCHTSDVAGFRKHVPDQACLRCHDGPVHNANQTFVPQCSSCHLEHRDAIPLTHVGDKTCTQCHSALKTRTGSPQFRNVSGFDRSGHPEFAANRPGFTDPGTIKYSHQAHMDLVACDACHVPANKIDLSPKEETRLGASGSPRPGDSVSATKGAYMAPIKFADHCVACHADKLEFDKRILDSVPHDTPEVIHAAILKHAPAGSALVAELEQGLWKDKCTYCHRMKSVEGGLPQVESSSIPKRWFLHADFSHATHKMVACQSCHTGAAASKFASDVLLPGAVNCQQCHRPNAAPSECSECHSYHDWRAQKAQQSVYDISCLLEKSSIQSCTSQSDERVSKKP